MFGNKSILLLHGRSPCSVGFGREFPTADIDLVVNSEVFFSAPRFFQGKRPQEIYQASLSKLIWRFAQKNSMLFLQKPCLDKSDTRKTLVKTSEA